MKHGAEMAPDWTPPVGSDQRYPRRGWGPWRSDWYSLCSMHYVYDRTCELCRLGKWVNHWRHALGSVVFRYAPDLWRWCRADVAGAQNQKRSQ